MKKLYSYILVFLGFILLFCALNTAVACIPRTLVEKNVRTSAQKLMEGPLFPQLTEGLAFTTQDNYADAILLNILLSQDSTQPFHSMLDAAYYHENTENVNVNLEEAVENGRSANTSYARYWHGAMVLVKPLLLLFDLDGIRIFFAVVLLLLFGVLTVLLIRKKQGPALIGLLVGLVLCGAWLVPVSLEYVSTFLLALAASLAVVCRDAERETNWGILFFAVGMLTAYADFLTTETLTLTLPLIFLLRRRYTAGGCKSVRETLLFCLKIVLLWGLGYALTFAAKWIVSGAFLGWDALTEALTDAGVRVYGEIQEDVNRYVGALVRNISCLLPLSAVKTFGGVIGGTLLALVAYGSVFYLFRREMREKMGVICALLCIGLVPYLRYLLLSNHAYIHYFFTYRAQAATLMAMTAALLTALFPRKKQVRKK